MSSNLSNPTAATRRHRLTVRLTTDAMLMAMYFVLGTFCTIRLPVVEISLTSLPILACAFLFGPLDAAVIGLGGAFLEQMVTYGVSPTTLLWILPPALQGLLAGLIAWLFHNRMKKWQTALTVLIAELFLTALNTAALYLDAHIMSYTVKALPLILPGRLLAAGARTAITMSLILFLLPPIAGLANRHGQVTAIRPGKQDKKQGTAADKGDDHTWA